MKTIEHSSKENHGFEKRALEKKKIELALLSLDHSELTTMSVDGLLEWSTTKRLPNEKS